MKYHSRFLPNGSLPYSSIDSTTRLIVKLMENNPYLPLLPMLDEKESLVRLSLQNIPGIRPAKGNKVILSTNSPSFKQGLVQLDTAYNHPNRETLAPYQVKSVYLEKYLQIIKKFKSKNACFNILGPFTISQMLLESSDMEQLLLDMSNRKLFVQAVVVKALRMIQLIKTVSPDTTPVIILEEPLFTKLGDVKRCNEEITVDLITNMFIKLVEKLKSVGALVAFQCFDKCDWKIPINAGVDIISFDAYNNPNNLSIIPDKVVEFLGRGGKINWAIAPVAPEALIKTINLDELEKRLYATFEDLIVAGVPEKLVYNRSMVSVNGDLTRLPLIYAEKIAILTSQLSKKIPKKS